MDLPAVRHRGAKPFTVPDRAGGSAWQVEAVELPDDQIVAVALSLGSVNVILRQLLIIEAIVGGIVLFLVGVVATIVVRLGLRPLTRIEHTAEAIAGGELDRRVPDSDPRTETGRLGAALNVMLGRLAAALHERERSEERLRQFVADASHELRTPLTSIRGFAELYRRGGARTPAEVELLTGRIEAEATRMGVLVEDLLLLARVLEVHDEGPGIPPDQASYVFDRFHSFDPRGTHHRGGSGLGLANHRGHPGGPQRPHRAAHRLPARHHLPRPAAVGLTVPP